MDELERYLPAPRSTPIKDAEWQFGIRLKVGDSTFDIGDLRFADSWVAKNPGEFARTVARFVDDQARKRSRTRKGKQK